MIQILCSNKVYEKLKHELSKYQIDIKQDSNLVVVERGYDVPIGKLAIIFDAIDYMDVVKLLVSGVREDHKYFHSITGIHDNKFSVIEPKNVVYIEAGLDGILAFTMSGSYRIKETLQYYESLWAAYGFIRINKSQLVNLLHVKEIIPWFNSRYVLKMANNIELEVSKIFSKKLRSTLNI